MGWIQPSELHKCALPEFDPMDIHDLGELWQCEDQRCNVVWHLSGRRSQGPPGPDQIGAYGWRRSDGPTRRFEF